MNLAGHHALGHTWKDPMLSAPGQLSQTTEGQRAPAARNIYQADYVTIHHCGRNKAWIPDDRFIHASPLTAEGLIRQGFDKFRKEAVPIHWKLISTSTGRNAEPNRTKRVAMFAGHDAASQFRTAARHAWVQLELIRKGAPGWRTRDIDYKETTANQEALRPSS